MDAPSAGTGDLAALNELLDQRNVPIASRAVVLEAVGLAQARGVWVVAEVSAGFPYVSLTPPGGDVAAYVQADRLRLRYDLPRALRTAQEYEFCTIDDDHRPGVSRIDVVISGWAVEQHAVVVRGLLLQSILIAAATLDARSPETARGAAARSSGARPGTSTAKAGTPASSSGGSAEGSRSRAARPPGSSSGTAPSGVSRSGVSRSGPSSRGARASAPSGTSPPRPPTKPAVCPIHFVQLVNGTCDYCEY